MKNTSSISLNFATYLIAMAVLIFLLLAAFPPSLRAQTNAPVAGGETNAVTALTNPAPAANAIAATKAKLGKLPHDSTPVRIDSSGVHVGGSEPVDINWGHGAGSNGFGQTLVDVLTAFVLPVFVAVVLPVVIIGGLLYYAHRREKMAHETLRALVEKGVPVTPELVAQLRSRHVRSPGQGGRSGGLLPGLIVTGVGAALLISNHGHSTGGLIILFVGVAFLVVWLVGRMDKNSNQPPKP